MSDIAVQTFLYDRHGSSRFASVQDVDTFTQKRYGYVEGFLSMTIDGNEMFGPDLWDDLAMLWPGLTIMLEGCRENRVGKTSLAERAIPIRLECIRGWSGYLLLTVGRPEGDHYGVEARRRSVAAADLYPAVARAYLDACENFRRIDAPRGFGKVSEGMATLLRSWIEAPRDSWFRIFPG